MSAVTAAPVRSLLILRPLDVTDLDEVLAIETQAHWHPWSRGNFIDSMAAGHRLQMLQALNDDGSPHCLGYCVAMPGVDEMHLLNITVRPDEQGRHLADRLMADLLQACADRGDHALWLEVRTSNSRAQRLYERWGFEAVGRRKAYYPAAEGREDAVVMKRTLEGTTHAVD